MTQRVKSLLTMKVRGPEFKSPASRQCLTGEVETGRLWEKAS